MLKLRKNKKGFTLVELIVVIAIMAVLAGTVAGVTVSQLNKNTDKANKTKAKQVADFIAGMIADPDDFKVITTETTTTPAVTTFNLSKVQEKVKAQFGEDYIAATASKGGFALTDTTDHKYIHVVYNGKASGGGIDYYISLDGTISTKAPDATTTETEDTENSGS